MLAGRRFVGRRRDVGGGGVAREASLRFGAGEQAEEPYQSALDPLREDEHDEDEDRAVGGDRDVGALGAGQAVAGGHVGGVGGDQDDQQASPHRARQAAQAAG